MLYATDHDSSAGSFLSKNDSVFDALGPGRCSIFIERKTMHVWRMQAMAGIDYVRPGYSNYRALLPSYPVCCTAVQKVNYEK
jgi:hypothetical protein